MAAKTYALRLLHALRPDKSFLKKSFYLLGRFGATGITPVCSVYYLVHPMCGIVGYIGHQKAEPILMNGLRRLEYRGYDSAGLAFLRNGEFEVLRTKGKLDQLVEKLKGRNFEATIGIGHTRWATHGKPDEANAHPHYSQDVVLVHNGIIENYRKLKSVLLAKGHKIVSETDTEIICHLIQEYLNQGNEFFMAMRRALKDLSGAYSLVIMHRHDPKRIYAVRMGSPLVVGQTPQECFVASDIPALLSHTHEVAFLHDGEIAVLQDDHIDFFDFDGKSLKKDFKKITWSASQAEKSGYKHFMIKEIHEQPRVLADTLLGCVNRDSLEVDFGDKTNQVLEEFSKKEISHLQIIACGTSWHAGLVGSYWIENLAKIRVSVDLSSEFRYRHPLVDKNTLVVAISQSGETADTLAALRESRRLGAKVLSICNVIESSIPRESDATIYTHAGPEIGVASTKAFVTQMAVLYLLTLRLALLKGSITREEKIKRTQALLELPSTMKHFLSTVQDIPAITEKIYRKEHCYFLGRGIQFPIALEGALKLKEISYVHAEGFAGGEMKHGPIALIEEGIPVVALVLQGPLYEKMVSNIQEIRARGATIFALISAGDATLENQADRFIEIPATHPDLQPFMTILPLQLIAYHVADKKGTDIDQPRNLAKSVTVE